MGDRGLTDLYNRTRGEAYVLYDRAAKTLELAERLEHLTKDTPPGTPARGLGRRRGRP